MVTKIMRGHAWARRYIFNHSNQLIIQILFTYSHQLQRLKNDIVGITDLYPYSYFFHGFVIISVNIFPLYINIFTKISCNPLFNEF